MRSWTSWRTARARTRRRLLRNRDSLKYVFDEMRRTGVLRMGRDAECPLGVAGRSLRPGELAPNPEAPPPWILPTHPQDQLSNLIGDRRPAAGGGSPEALRPPQGRWIGSSSTMRAGPLGAIRRAVARAVSRRAAPAPSGRRGRRSPAQLVRAAGYLSLPPVGRRPRPLVCKLDLAATCRSLRHQPGSSAARH